MDDNEKLIERLRAVIETATSDAYTAASQMNVTREDHAATERDVTEAETVRDLVIAELVKAHAPELRGSTVMNGVHLDPNRPEPPFPGGVR